MPAMGNFSIQYNFQSISVALIMMSAFECTSDDGNCKDGKQAGWVASTASAAVFAGAIVGQLTVDVCFYLKISRELCLLDGVCW